MRKMTFLLVPALVAACGGAGSPVTTTGATDVTTPGTDYPMVPVEAISHVQSGVCPASAYAPSAFGLSYFVVELGDVPGRCGRLAAGQEKADSGVVVIEIARKRTDETVPGFRIGSYPISASGVAQPDGTLEVAMVRLANYDSWCDLARESAVSGTITVDAVDGTGIRGSVSVGMQSGGTVSGAFFASPCAVDVFFECTGYLEFPPITTCLP